MTLIEVSIAIVIVSIIFAALAGLLTTSVKAQQLNETRVQGTQFAQERVENLRAVPWSLLGLYSNESSYRSIFEGEPTVDLGSASSPRDQRVPRPTQSQTLGDVQYTVVTDVTWAPGSDATKPRAKNVDVTVSWEQYGATRSVRVDAQRASTSMEVPVVSTASLPFSVAVTATPTAVELDSAGSTVTGVLVSATANTAVSQMRVSYNTRNGVTETAEMDVTGDPARRTFTLAAGSGPFDPGTARFTVQATDLYGAQATVETSVELTAESGAFAITSVSPRPTSVNLSIAGRNAEQFVIEATFSRPATTATVSLPTTGFPTTLTMNLAADRLSGSAAVAAGAYLFPNGDHAVTVTASASTSTSASRAMSFVAAGIPDVEVVAVNAAPSPFCAESTGQQPLKTAVTVIATVNGLRTTDKVQMRFNSKNQPIKSATSADGTIWTVLLPAGSLQFKGTGLTTKVNATVTATRLPDGTPTTRTQPFDLRIGGC
jgi:Tfp pilus assembly protein PilV